MSEWVPTRGLAWQAAVCLLLVGLVIFNPYLAAPDTYANTCIRRIPSNRATVGASELQHFTPTDKRSVLIATDVALIERLDRVPRYSESYEDPMEAVFSPAQFQSESLWFRPPPAV
jgi:hypothetical protein